MIIIGCDYHPSFQQIAWVNTETGEIQERKLPAGGEAERFYRELKGPVRVGLGGPCQPKNLFTTSERPSQTQYNAQAAYFLKPIIFPACERLDRLAAIQPSEPR